MKGSVRGQPNAVNKPIGQFQTVMRKLLDLPYGVSRL